MKLNAIVESIDNVDNATFMFMTSRHLERSSCDPNIFNAHYFENGSIQGVGYNRAPIGNGMRSIKWSHD